MKEEKKKINKGGTGSYQQIISEFSATQMESKKVDATVTTFLNQESIGSLFKRAIGYIYQTDG